MWIQRKNRRKSKRLQTYVDNCGGLSVMQLWRRKAKIVGEFLARTWDSSPAVYRRINLWDQLLNIVLDQFSLFDALLFDHPHVRAKLSTKQTLHTSCPSSKNIYEIWHIRRGCVNTYCLHVRVEGSVPTLFFASNVIFQKKTISSIVIYKS